MSKIIEGLDKAIAHQVQNIVRLNPKGSSAEQILLGKFLGSDQGAYARNVLGKNHKGWIEHITTWLKKNQPRLEKEFNELDFSDLTSLAYDMYENYLAKQGQLEEGEVVSLQARKTPLVVAGSPYDWDIYDLRTNKMVANILGGDRHESPLYEIRIRSTGMTPTTRMLPTYVLRAGRNNNPPYKAYELVDTADRYGKIEKSPGPGGTTKLRPDEDDMLRHMFKVMGGGKYYGYDLNLVEEGLDQYEIIEKALGAKIMEIDDAMELGYTDWDPEDSSSIVYLGNQKNEGINEFFDTGGGGDGDDELKRQVVEMYFEDGLRETEIARITGLSELAVNNIIDQYERGDFTIDEGYSAGASGGAGLGEKINTPGGMGQSYRKYKAGPSGIKKKKTETAIPMFTPETKMVNANDPGSDGWKIYSAKPSGILEGIITEYDTKTIDSVVQRLPKGLDINNFTHPAFKEFLYQKYYGPMKAGWDKLWPFFSKEYNEKHGIKEYKQNPHQILSGDIDFFDDMLLVIPKGLKSNELYTRAFKEFLYKKFGNKEWTDFKKNRFTYWDAYEKMGGSKPQGFFGKLKSKIGMDENLLRTYGDQFGLDEDVYTDSLYKEFLYSEYNKNQGSYIDTLRNLGQFMRSKDMPEEKVKPLIRKLIAKLHPSGINEEQMQIAELKCWAGYTRVRGVPAGAPGSCKKKTKESNILKGLQAEEKIDEYKEVPSQRKIEFSKENPPDLYYLYQQFIQRMLDPENTVDPYDWIDQVNKYYGLNYSWKDYQKRGHNDHTDNWQKIINKYILKK